jgi:hypothetical protein
VGLANGLRRAFCFRVVLILVVLMRVVLTLLRLAGRDDAYELFGAEQRLGVEMLCERVDDRDRLRYVQQRDLLRNRGTLSLLAVKEAIIASSCSRASCERLVKPIPMPRKG